MLYIFPLSPDIIAPDDPVWANLLQPLGYNNWSGSGQVIQTVVIRVFFLELMYEHSVKIFLYAEIAQWGTRQPDLAGHVAESI